jgi:predicted ATPase
MGIQELEVKGFRSLRNVQWKPGKLNVLIGPNGSGKSNLLQALELLKRATEGKLSDAVLRQGGIAALLWDAKAQRISWNLKSRLEAPQSEPSEAFYKLEMQQLGTSSAFRIESETLQIGDNIRLDRGPATADIIDDNGIQMSLPQTLVSDEQSSLAYMALAGAQTTMFSDSLMGWSFYQNLRTDREAPVRQAAIARLENKLAADGQNLASMLHTAYTGDREFKKNLDAAMRAAFGTDYEELIFPPAADQRIQLRLRWRSLSTEQSAANLSDGTLRFLMLIAILTNPRPGDLIAIDEPETGLHPNMLPIIAELATEAAYQTQVIFTTHSPQFLDAFRDEAPTTTVTEWEDGETRLSVLDGKELEKWLKHYSLGELFRSGELEAIA